MRPSRRLLGTCGATNDGFVLPPRGYTRTESPILPLLTYRNAPLSHFPPHDHMDSHFVRRLILGRSIMRSMIGEYFLSVALWAIKSPGFHAQTRLSLLCVTSTSLLPPLLLLLACCLRPTHVMSCHVCTTEQSSCRSWTGVAHVLCPTLPCKWPNGQTREQNDHWHDKTGQTCTCPCERIDTQWESSSTKRAMKRWSDVFYANKASWWKDGRIYR